MKQMKRWLAMLLCFVMLVGVLPVNAMAADWSDVKAFIEAAIAEHQENGGELPSLPNIAPETDPTEESTEAPTEESTEAPTEESTEETTEPTVAEEPEQADDGVLQILALSDYTGSMSGVLNQVKAANADIDDLFFLGDSTDLGAMMADVQGYYTLDTNAVLVQGDKDAVSDLTALPGMQNNDSYSTFVINEREYQEYGKEIVSALALYLTGKVTTGYDKPIFVLTHRGLHDGTNNAYAKTVFKALNKAGEEGLEIVYIYGDSGETSLGDGAVYLPVESPISIDGAEEVLNFTYMNAGAVSETATVFTFNKTTDTVSVSRYDANGLTLLKSAGTADPFTQDSPAVVGEPAPVAVTEEPMFGTFDLTKAADEEAGIDAQADDTIYILAGGDYQEAGDHANSAENVTNILAQISQKYTTMDGFLFIGDYDCETHNDATETANGITSLMDTVDNVYTNITDANSVLAQGNHDYMDSRIDSTGGHDFDGYAAYVLNEDDYPNGGGSQSGVQTLANNLAAWLTTKTSEQYSAPIFIVSHLPLAFTPRTVTQGDAKYAKLIFDVLNDAGSKGLNIIFLHGHDHAYGPDNYMGGEAIYLPKGDKICIAETGSTSAWTEETLNFTYMNAGYTGYYSDPYTYVTTAGTDKLTMTVFAITDSEVTVERYSANGKYNLKSAGYDGSYSNTSVTNVSLGLPTYSAVYASPQTIALTTASSGGSTGGDSFTAGTIGEYVGVSDDVDDVTTSGGKWITITEATNGTEGSDPTYQYVLDTDGIDYGSDNKYLIVARDAAYLLDAGSGVAVTLSSDGKTATTSTTNYEYYFTTGGLITRDGTNTLYQQNWGIHVGNVSGSNLNGFTNLNNGYYRIYDTDGTARSLYWDGDSWTVTSSNHTDSTYSVRLYKFDQIIPGSDATPGSNGLYGYLDGDLSYVVASGTSADDALAAVKAGIAVKYSYYEDYSNVGDYADDGEGMTWTLDSAYNGTTPGDYAVTIAYNGTVLGTAEVIIADEVTYYIAEGDGLYTVDMNTSADDALAAVKAGITVSSATDTNGTNKTTIDDSNVTWNWVDTYDGTDNGPYTVEILYDGTSLGTVEVQVDVTYDTTIAEGWTNVGTTEGGYKYVLDTDGIDYNTSATSSSNRYIIVAADKAIALGATPTGTVDVTLSADGTTAIVSSRNNEYHFYNRTNNNGRGIYICNSSGQYLYHGNYVFSLNSSRSGRAWTSFTHNGSGVYTLLGTDNNGDWQMYYSNSNSQFRVADGSGTVRLYKYEGEAEASTIYAHIEGSTSYTVNQGKSATYALSVVKAGITGYISNNADGSNATELDDNDLTWTWLNTYKGQTTPGTYYVQISYKDKVLGTVAVKVEPGVVNNYPEYPNEGAVKVSKTATGIDFQSSGIAQVELSASGVPIKKGVDVVVMLDTSSSMTSHTVSGTDKTRAEVLEESLEDLIAQFKTPGDDGELLDISVAIADFNGFYGENQSTSGTAYDRDAADMMSDDIYYNAASEAQIYTGNGTLSAGAFVDAAELANSYTLNYTSGTNYDYAMDAIYQLATAKKAANGNEERDLFVIFMSDGAAMQWNYYHSQGASSLWNNWITGAWKADELTTTNLNCTTHAYYYDEVDHDGDGIYNEHRMAEAIKGSTSEEYEVIRKTNTLGTATGETNMYMVPGLGAKMFSISFDAQADDKVTEASMDKSIASLASDQTGTTQYYYKVTSADELSNAFSAIGNEIAYAAYNARMVDQMGDDFNLQMTTSTYTVVDGDTTTSKTLTPKIEIISYDIYTRQDYLNGTITEDKIGNRKGTYTVLETVTFTDDGNGNVTGAYSDQINGGATNILADGTQDGYVKGVIYAKTFLYNTNATDVAVDGVAIPTGTTSAGLTTGTTNVLPSETFYWKMGTVTTAELAMRYYVYLEGSMEGTREAGSYPTNEYATLYYDNYLNNPCYKDTVSPVMAWKEANVSYAFYLVDENGNIIVNQTTGQTGSFANKIAVTNPVVYKTVLLNNEGNVQAIKVTDVEGSILPLGYELYDSGAEYEVTINSNTTGSWEITNGGVAVNSTYVTQYNPNNAAAYSNELSVDTIGNDYTHTVVWFAVLWKVQALPDTVVIDYGLPVDISVLTNDMFGENGKLAGVGALDTEGITLDGYTADNKLPNTTYTGTYGVATADATTGKVRYTLNTSNGMQMQTYEKFAYAVNYTGTTNPGYYYDTVTVIPATTIYYEDSFLTFSGNNANGATTGVIAQVPESGAVSGQWYLEGTAIDGATQSEDRPGKYSLTDANNIYGYDGVNLNMSTYSLNSAAKVHVDANSYATAEFTFTGTGFDVISMTSSDTGVMVVQVFDKDNNQVEVKTVDTYYGVSYTLCNVEYRFMDPEGDGTGEWYEYVLSAAEGATEEVVPKLDDDAEIGDTVQAILYKWIATPNNNAIYQVPVIEFADLPYAQYRVVLTATYVDVFNNVGDGSYDLYLDAIRIYDPANDGAADGSEDTTIEDAYKADGEGWPSYIELRNNLITAETLGNASTDTKVTGLVFIDGDEEVGDAQMADYISYGPNNEVYLAPGQRVAFLLSTPANIANVHIGIKSADGKTGTYTITNIAQASNADTGVDAGDYYGAKTATVNTTTDMYYDLTGWKNDIIVISNTGDRYDTEGIISLTNIKSTYTSDPNATSTASVMALSLEEETVTESAETYIYMTPAAATLTLRSLNGELEETEPEVTEPETTVPEETEPETTVPEETEPETTGPEATEPEEEEDEIQNVVNQIVNTIRDTIKNLFGKWFR